MSHKTSLPAQLSSAAIATLPCLLLSMSPTVVRHPDNLSSPTKARSSSITPKTYFNLCFNSRSRSRLRESQIRRLRRIPSGLPVWHVLWRTVRVREAGRVDRECVLIALKGIVGMRMVLLPLGLLLGPMAVMRRWGLMVFLLPPRRCWLF